MGTLTSALLTLMLSWVRGFVALLWSIANEGGAKMLDWFAQAWLPLSLCIIAVGLLMDRIVWFTHYGPNRFASGRAKKKTGISDDRGNENSKLQTPEEDNWLPEAPFAESEKEEDEKIYENAAADIPDAELAPYPGMRYDPAATGDTRRVAAVQVSGETKSFSPARTAQQEYERKMEDYRQRQAQYERDLEEYKRQKAAYDAALAAEAKSGSELKNAADEATADSEPESAVRRRRRSMT